MVAAATPERVEWKLSVEAAVSAAILQRARDTRAATVRPAGGTPAATVAAFSAGAKCLILVEEVSSNPRQTGPIMEKSFTSIALDRCSHRFAIGRIRPVCGPVAG